jgi:hypothetical protein
MRDPRRYVGWVYGQETLRSIIARLRDIQLRPSFGEAYGGRFASENEALNTTFRAPAVKQ